MSRIPLPIRYRLSLSTFGGIVPGASHWWCRVYWRGSQDENFQEENAEHGRGRSRSQRFATEREAIAAGVRLSAKLAEGNYRIVTLGSHTIIDPQLCLAAPGNLRSRLNTLWRRFEKLNGWEAPKSKHAAVQKVCDSWSALVGEKWS